MNYHSQNKLCEFQNIKQIRYKKQNQETDV